MNDYGLGELPYKAGLKLYQLKLSSCHLTAYISAGAEDGGGVENLDSRQNFCKIFVRPKYRDLETDRYVKGNLQNAHGMHTNCSLYL